MMDNLAERAVKTGLSALALMVDEADMLRQQKAELEALYENLQEHYSTLSNDLIESQAKLSKVLAENSRLYYVLEGERESVAEWLDVWLYCDANDYDLASTELDIIRQASYDYVAEYRYLLPETFMDYELADHPEDGADDEKEAGTPPDSNFGDIPF